jgi:predicted permease
MNGYRYFVTFIDYFSRVTWVYLMKNKSEVFDCLLEDERGRWRRKRSIKIAKKIMSSCMRKDKKLP